MARTRVSLQGGAAEAVFELANAPASAQGRVLALWARAFWRQGRHQGQVDPLARVLV